MRLDQSPTMSGSRGDSEDRDEGGTLPPLPPQGVKEGEDMEGACVEQTERVGKAAGDYVTQNTIVLGAATNDSSSPNSELDGIDIDDVVYSSSTTSVVPVVAVCPSEVTADATLLVPHTSCAPTFRQISSSIASAQINPSLEVEQIDKLKLSSNSLAGETGEAEDDVGVGCSKIVKESNQMEDNATLTALTRADPCHNIPVLPRSAFLTPSPPMDDKLGSSPPLAESLCCVGGDLEEEEVEDRSLRRSSSSRKCLVFDDHKIAEKFVVSTEGEVSRHSAPSQLIDDGVSPTTMTRWEERSLSESRLTDKRQCLPDGVDEEEDALHEDLSPLQHPNPYPIPHLDSPEGGDEADDDSSQPLCQVSFPVTTTSLDPGPNVTSGGKPSSPLSTPLFERGISPSSVKQHRTAQLNGGGGVSSSAASSSSSHGASESPSGGRHPSDSGGGGASPRPGSAHPATPAVLQPPPNPSSSTSPSSSLTPSRNYDYILKFLLVGDSDVGKDEILSCLSEEVSESPYDLLCNYKTTTILIDGKRVKLQLWDTSGQGRFCTILRSYSRGAQGILLVYDITNKWSFDGIDRWLKEVCRECLIELENTAYGFEETMLLVSFDEFFFARNQNPELDGGDCWGIGGLLKFNY